MTSEILRKRDTVINPGGGDSGGCRSVPAVTHGGDVYRNNVRLDYSVNLNPMPMPACILEAARAGLGEMNQYPDPYQQELKKRISAYEGVSPDNIICGSGASELLMAVCHAFLPRKALITAPCYAGYRRALEAANAEVIEYMLREDAEFELGEGFIEAITDDIDMVFIADPNNPNGRLIDPDVRRRIIETCDARGIELVIDECFYPLTERGADRVTLEGRILHLRAFTKTFAIPGIRIGYLISSDKTLLDKTAIHLPEWNVSRIAERAGEAAADVLKDTDYLAESVRLIGDEREYLRRELESMSIRTFESDTNYLLFRHRSGLYEKLLEHGIMIRKCDNFTGLDDTYYRIAVRRHEDNEVLVSTLKEVLQRSARCWEQ